MVATTGVAPALTPVKDEMLPVPPAASPMPGVSLLQLYTVPPTAPVKFTATTAAPLHIAWSAGSTTVGVGFTVIVNVCGVPVHAGPAVWGVTVIVATTAVVPAFTAANDAMQH